MIITTSKHGRNSSDSSKLVAHLLKPENDAIEVLEIGNSVATDIDGVLRDMEVVRAGSRAIAGFHHLSVNPGQDCSKDQLLACVHRVRLELDPDGERAYVVICHTKKRATPEGAPIHAHLVLANVDAHGRALKDGRSKIRTECIARICEYELGEPPTLGRHHKSALKLLSERNLPLVRAWLVEAFGEDPERPRSAMSAETRQRAKRLGVDLPQAKAAVATLWSVTGTMESFKTALKDEGYVLAPGKKENVWVVLDGDGRMVGAVDRLLRKKRHEIRHLMENPNERAVTEIRSRSAPLVDRARSETIRPIEADRGKDRPFEPAAQAARSAGGRGRRGPDRADSRIARDNRDSEPRTIRSTGADRCKARYPAGRRARHLTLTQLRAIGRAISRMAAHQDFSEEREKREQAPKAEQNYFDLWGIARTR